MTLKEKAAALLAATNPRKVTFEIMAHAPVGHEDREDVVALVRYAFDNRLGVSSGESPDGMWATVTISEG